VIRGTDGGVGVGDLVDVQAIETRTGWHAYEVRSARDRGRGMRLEVRVHPEVRCAPGRALVKPLRRGLGPLGQPSPEQRLPRHDVRQRREIS